MWLIFSRPMRSWINFGQPLQQVVAQCRRKRRIKRRHRALCGQLSAHPEFRRGGAEWNLRARRAGELSSCVSSLCNSPPPPLLRLQMANWRSYMDSDANSSRMLAYQSAASNEPHPSSAQVSSKCRPRSSCVWSAASDGGPSCRRAFQLLHFVPRAADSSGHSSSPISTGAIRTDSGRPKTNWRPTAATRLHFLGRARLRAGGHPQDRHGERKESERASRVRTLAASFVTTQLTSSLLFRSLFPPLSLLFLYSHAQALLSLSRRESSLLSSLARFQLSARIRSSGRSPSWANKALAQVGWLAGWLTDWLAGWLAKSDWLH